MASNQMNIQEILKCLPHRFPFVLVDRVLEVKELERIRALKNITFNEEFFQGHFPHRAVMPGVLILEALAQVSGILAYKSSIYPPENTIFYLGAIGVSRFKKPVIPGDQLILESKVIIKRSKVWKFSCVASVEDRIVCESEITCMEGSYID